MAFIEMDKDELELREILERRFGKLNADGVKKALEAKLDEWEEYIREVDRRNLKGLRRFD